VASERKPGGESPLLFERLIMAKRQEETPSASANCIMSMLALAEALSECGFWVDKETFSALILLNRSKAMKRILESAEAVDRRFSSGRCVVCGLPRNKAGEQLHLEGCKAVKYGINQD